MYGPLDKQPMVSPGEPLPSYRGYQYKNGKLKIDQPRTHFLVVSTVISGRYPYNRIDVPRGKDPPNGHKSEAEERKNKTRDTDRSPKPKS